MSLGNPYVVDRPLAEGDHSVNRYEALVGVVQGIRRGRRLVLVYGAPGAGKTSLLRHMARELMSEFVVVKVDVTWPGSDDPREAVSELRSEVSRELDNLSGERAYEARGSTGAEGDRVVVVLIDGLSVLDLRGDRGATFVSLWQEWMEQVPEWCFVAAVEGTPEGATRLSPALASLRSLELKALTLEETEELLVTPVRGRLTYEFAATQRVWQLTGGHPYFAQLFGHVLFNRLVSGGRVTLHDVEAAADDVLARGQVFMQQLWMRCSAQARLALALTPQLRGRHGVLHVLDLRDAARREGVEVRVSSIEAALDELVAIGLVSTLGPDSLSFSVDLFRQWLNRYGPASDAMRDLKAGRYPAADLTSRRLRSLRFSSLGVGMATVAVLAAVVLLWNARGSGQRLAVGGAATPTPSPFATRATLVVGPALGRIAYMARENADADWDIWLMRGDGSDPQRLTDDPADDMSPCWSPRGDLIAFVAERDGNREVYTMKPDGTQQINLTQHPSEDWAPAWSPEGTSIAFSSYRDGNWEIYVMDADGSNPVRITSNAAADYGPCWSPDGARIAFHSNRDGNWEIYVVGASGEGLRRLTEDEATDFAPAWSPDGAMIAFESYRDGNMEIYLMFADGSEQYNISNDPYSNEHGPDWARDGLRLLFFSNRDSGWDIFSMRPDGTEKNNLTLSPALEHGPRWHE